MVMNFLIVAYDSETYLHAISQFIAFSQNILLRFPDRAQILCKFNSSLHLCFDFA